MDLMDPDTNTEARRVTAKSAVPVLVDKMIADDLITSIRIETLYRELRALHRSKPPFRMHIDNVRWQGQVDIDSLDAADVVQRFREPETVTRHEAACLLAALYHKVAAEERLRGDRRIFA